MGRAEAMIAQAAPPEAPERCDVPCTVDAARTKCTRSFHGVKVAFAFDTPLTPPPGVVVRAGGKREVESLSGQGERSGPTDAASCPGHDHTRAYFQMTHCAGISSTPVATAGWVICSEGVSTRHVEPSRWPGR